MAQGGSRRRRLAALAATIALAAALMAPGATADPGGPTVAPPPNPGLRGHALWDSYYDLSSFGYQEQEYFISGTATDGAGGSAPYTTRIIVTRPTDPARFNGTAVLDWVNVTAQFENAVDTMEARQMLMREGFAYVHVSAQAAGICCTPLTPKVWDPVRYQSLDHPGDAYADDIFTQAAIAVRDKVGLDPKHLIAVGQSQSCGTLQNYILNVQPTTHVIDGFLIHGCDAKKSTSTHQDLQAKVLHLLSDNEADPTVPQDNPNYRLWEVAGTAHSDYFIGYQSEIGSGAHVLADQPPIDRTTYDQVMQEAGNYGAEIHPLLATCILAGSTMPMHYAVSAAIHELDTWVNGGPAPDNGPLFTYAGTTLQKDGDLNTEGGIRMPPIEVPVATYDSTRCPLGGITVPMSDVQLRLRYPTFDGYWAKMKAATDTAASRHWMLGVDAVDMMERVCAAQNRWGLSGQPCPEYQPPPDAIG